MFARHLFITLLFGDEKAMTSAQPDCLSQIETAIAEALARIERQRQIIVDFETRGYDIRAPLTLLSCLLFNLRKLEDRRRQELQGDVVAV